MKHLHVIESSAGKKWSPASFHSSPHAYYSKTIANRVADRLLAQSPGLQWRVAKYERVK
jgi:hypothetical protein